MNKKYFLLYENCIPVLGKNESLIMDIQRNEYYSIPNLLFQILNNDLRNINIEELKNKYNNKYDAGIEKYFNYLIEKELGFLTIEPKLFPKMSLNFKLPFKLLTAVISYDNKSKYSLEESVKQLVDLGCQSIQIRIFETFKIKLLTKVLNLTNDSRVKIVEVYLENKNYDLKILKEIMCNNLRVKFFLHTSSKNEKVYVFNDDNSLYISLTTKKLQKRAKELYSKNLFVCNTHSYTEAKNYNIGLNRKICIDLRGYIKNYISHNKEFGQASGISLKEIIELDEFKEKWHITNDMIEKCKECQYRYMCLSNSDIELKNGKYYKSNYCNFNL